MKLKIALLQILPRRSIEEQFTIGKKACKRAKTMGADIALFPEMWSSGYYIPNEETRCVTDFIRGDGHGTPIV